MSRSSVAAGSSRSGPGSAAFPDPLGRDGEAPCPGLDVLQDRLAKAQHRLSRVERFGRNRYKRRRQINRLHRRIADTRNEHLHKLSHAIGPKPSTWHVTVFVEDLQVRNMTTSAKGTVEAPGGNVRATSGLRHAYLDDAPCRSLRFALDPGSRAPLRDAGLLVRASGGGVQVHHDEERVDALRALAAEGGLRLVWRVTSADPAFVAYTRPALMASERVLYLHSAGDGVRVLRSHSDARPDRPAVPVARSRIDRRSGARPAVARSPGRQPRSGSLGWAGKDRVGHLRRLVAGEESLWQGS